jgi:hypothetical protein
MGKSHGPKAKIEGVHISEKELIGDQGLKSTVTLDSGKLETPKPDIDWGKVTVKCRKP